MTADERQNQSTTPSQTVSAFEFLEKIVQEINSECYLVGGFLRDILLQRETKDIDIAVSSNPKIIAEKLANRFKSPFITLEEEREIYRVFLKDGIQFDIAKFKGKSIEEDLSKRDFTVNAMAYRLTPSSEVRNQEKKEVHSPQSIVHSPQVSNLKSAIFNLQSHIPYLTSHILDPHGGKNDLEQKIIRQISADIYDDDPLRMLRAYRIASQLSFGIESKTTETIQKNKKKIHQTAAERIREEILLLLDSSDSYPYFVRLDESGLISEIFPEVDPNRRCADHYYPGKGVWGHSLDSFKFLEWIFKNIKSEFPENHEKLASFLFSVGDESEGHPRSALMKCAAFLHDLGKAPTAKIIENRMRFFEHQSVGSRIAAQIGKRLKFSANAIKSLSIWVENHMRPGGLAFADQLTDRAKFRFFRDLEKAAIPVLLISLADRYTYIPEILGKNEDPHEKVTKELIRWHYQKELESLSKKPKLINGNVLMEKLNLPPGPLIGQILKAVEEAAVLEEIKTPEEALDFAKKFL